MIFRSARLRFVRPEMPSFSAVFVALSSEALALSTKEPIVFLTCATID
jgi:hypothetical protein